MTNSIYILYNNRQEGPYSLEQIHQMLASEQLAPVSLARRRDMNEWVPLYTIIPETRSYGKVSLALGEVSSMRPLSSRTQDSIAFDKKLAAGDRTPQGIGGWLLFFCFQNVVLGPLYTLYSVVKEGKGWSQVYPLLERHGETVKTALFLEIAGFACIVIYGMAVGYIVWSGSSKGLKTAKRFLLIKLIGILGLEFSVLTLLVIGGVPEPLVAYVATHTTVMVIVQLLYFTAWWLYFAKSTRVKNTYTTTKSKSDPSTESAAVEQGQQPSSMWLGIDKKMLLIIGCMLHIMFSAEGIFRPDGAYFPWNFDHPSLFLTAAVGYAIPGIVVSILLLAPVCSLFSPKKDSRVYVLGHITCAVYMGFLFRIASFALP